MRFEDCLNLNELGQIWSIPEPWSVRPTRQGDNNLSQVIETPSGSYILRTYRSDRSLARIKYELGVLKDLQQRALPFRIPVPVPTVTGELVAISSGNVVTLAPWLSGSLPQNDNLEQTYAAGQALAELVKALHEVEVEVTPQVAPFPPSVDFEAWAGIAINPVDLIRELPLTGEEQKQTLALLARTQAAAPSLYQTLPQQIIHRDYDPSNILMEGNSVTAVLDFEFCGHDLRILDLAYALSKWPDSLWNTGKEWPVLDAFGQGYLQRQKLTLVELERLNLVADRYPKGIEEH